MKTESGGSAPSQYNPTANSTLTIAQIKAIISQDWPGFLSRYGLTQHQLSGKHSSCPLGCGGKRSFRFQNKCKFTGELKGMSVCTHCTGGALRDGYTLIAMLRFNGNNSEAFKSIISEFNANASTKDETSAPTLKIEQLANQEEKRKQQEQEFLSRKKVGSYHTEAILALCTKAQHGYFVDKGYINHKERVTTQNYEVHYERPNHTTGKIEKKIQKIPCGSAIIALHEIGNPNNKTSFQYIHPQPNLVTGKYYKGMLVDAPSDGIHIIYGDTALPYIGIVEGKATGKAVHIMTQATVVVAFNANGISSKAEQIQAFFPGKKLVVFGDNDVSNTGQKAAHKTASLRNGFAVIPPNTGDDWDDHLQKYGEESTKSEINRQLAEFKDPIIISENVVGISINSSILLANMTTFSFNVVLSNYIGMQCRCPLSGGHAIINSGSIWSCDENKIIVPILSALHDEKLITECRALKTMSKRVLWVNHYHFSQKHLYALIWVLCGRFGVDILEYKDFERLLERYTGCSVFSGGVELKHLHNLNKIVISPEIHNFIQYLLGAKIKQAAKLWELNLKKFKHYREVKQPNQGRIDWQPTVDEIITGHHSIIAVQAIHGQGKTEDLAGKISRRIPAVVYMTHRAKLVAQGCTVLKLYHYQDDKKIIQLAGYVNGLACCTPSFKHEINLNHIRKAKLIIIDEFIQWFSDLLTNKKCIDHQLPSKLRSALQESISKGCKIVLLDADLTTKGIQQFMRFLNVENDDVLLVVVENPKREHTSMISISTARAHYQTRAIKSMENDLEQFQPFLVAVESEAAAYNLYDKFRKNYPESHIVLLTGNKCLIQKDGLEIISKSKIFIDKINDNLLTVDALIYTNVIGTGVSINHHNQRFKKCYGLFGGWVLSPMDAIQMIKRGRNVTDFYIGLLCHPFDLYMTSFYKDIGSISWLKLSSDSDDIDKISAEIEFIKKQSATVFISALLGLLRDKHKFSVTIDQPAEDKIDDLKSTEELVKEYQQRLIASKPHPSLEQALSLQMDEYRNDEERFSCEAKICMDYYNMTAVTVEAAELWLNPAKKVACDRLELIVRILRSDPDLTVKNPKMQRDILIKSGVTLELITSRILSQEEIIRFRNLLAAHCDLLVGLRFIPERYVKSSAISIIKPIVPVQKILNYIGINAVTIRKEGGRELEISVPTPMVNRLKLAIKRTKKQEEELLKEKALAMRSEGKGHKVIAKELNFKNKDEVRRLLGK